MNRLEKKKDNNALPVEGFLRLKQIIGDRKRNIPAIVPVGRTTWLSGVEKGVYPKPVQLSERTVGWRVEDIRALINDLSLANDN